MGASATAFTDLASGYFDSVSSYKALTSNEPTDFLQSAQNLMTSVTGVLSTISALMESSGLEIPGLISLSALEANVVKMQLASLQLSAAIQNYQNKTGDAASIAQAALNYMGGIAGFVGGLPPELVGGPQVTLLANLTSIAAGKAAEALDDKEVKAEFDSLFSITSTVHSIISNGSAPSTANAPVSVAPDPNTYTDGNVTISPTAAGGSTYTSTDITAPSIVDATAPASGAFNTINVTGGSIVFGSSGQDLIQTGDGQNYIVGGGGNDMILAGNGNNTVYAGQELTVDELTSGAGTGVKGASVTVGNGDNTIYGSQGGDEINTGSGNNLIYTGSGDDLISLSGTTFPGMLSANWSFIESKSDGDKYYTSAQEINQPYTEISPANDYSSGYEGPGYGVYGGVPADLGNNTVVGGTGNNFILLSNGDNLVELNAGNSTVFGGMGNDTVFGGSGGDVVFGGGGDSYLVAGTGNQLLVGLGGNNEIFGGSGTDTIYAGDNPGISVPSLAGSNYVEAGSGDTLIFGSSLADTLLGGDGDDTIWGGTGAEYLDGGNGNNYLAAGSGADTLVSSGSGNDTLVGSSGSVMMFGGSGADDFILDAGDAVIFAGDGGTTNAPSVVTAGAGNATVVGGSGALNVQGSTGALLVDLTFGDSTVSSSVFAGSGDTTVYGGEAPVYIVGGSGNDELYGGDGNGTVIQAGSGNTTIHGGDGTETITGGIGQDLIYAGNADGDVINGGAGMVTIYGGLGTDSIFGGTGDDVIYAGDGGTQNNATYVTAGSGRNTLTAGAGYTVLDASSSSADNILVGGSGNTTLMGGSGSDSLEAGNGSSFLIAGGGDETLISGTGSATMQGGSGNNLFVVDNINTLIEASSSANSNVVESSVDFSAPDYIDELDLAGSGNLHAVGNGTGMVIRGNDGNDTLDAGTGNNTVYSGTTNTTMIAGAGNDILNGDGENNLFVINAGSGNVQINDAAGTNIVDLSDAQELSEVQYGSVQNEYNQEPDLEIQYAGKTISVTNALNDNALSFEFADGTSYTLDQMLEAGPAFNQSWSVQGGELTVDTNSNLNMTLPSGNNTILAWGSNDTLQAGAGAQSLSAFAQNEVLIGGSGTDTLTGSRSGDDTLVAGTGETKMLGGGFDNSYVLTSDGQVEIDSSAGTGKDVIWLPEGASLNDYTSTRDGSDLLLVSKVDHTVAVIKDYYSAVAQGRSWWITDGTTSMDSLDLWVSGSQSDTTSYAAQTSALETTALAKIEAQVESLGAAGRSLNFDEVDANDSSFYYVPDEGDAGYGGSYVFTGVNTESLTVSNDGTLNVAPSQWTAGVDAQVVETISTEQPVFATVSRPGKTVTVQQLELVVDSSGHVHSQVVTYNEQLPATVSLVQTGTQTVNSVVDVDQDTFTRTDTVYQITTDDSNNVIQAQGVFRGTVVLGNGNNMVTLDPGSGGSDGVIGGTGYPFEASTTGAGAFIKIGNGSDTVIGSNGDDTIVAGTGYDVIDGGLGADTYYVPMADHSYTVIRDSAWPIDQWSYATYGGQLPLDTLVLPDGVTTKDLSYRIYADPDDSSLKILELHYGAATVEVIYGDPPQVDPSLGVTMSASVGVDLFRFSDGTVLTRNQLISQMQQETTGATTSTETYADGSYSQTVDDGQGTVTTSSYTASGVLASDTWYDATGDRGMDEYQSNGAGSGTTYRANGSYNVWVNDGAGTTSNTGYNENGMLSDQSWSNSDGSSGYNNYYDNGAVSVQYTQFADGSSIERDNNQDGSYRLASQNSQQWRAQYFSSSNELVSDSWRQSTGNSGSDDYNVDGTLKDASVQMYSGDTSVVQATGVPERISVNGGQHTLDLGSGTTSDHLWFQSSGNDLVISVLGSAEKETITNWYSGTSYQLTQIVAGDGKTLDASGAEQLVQAMAAFSPPLPGQATYTQAEQAQLQTVLAANWH